MDQVISRNLKKLSINKLQWDTGCILLLRQVVAVMVFLALTEYRLHWYLKRNHKLINKYLEMMTIEKIYEELNKLEAMGFEVKKDGESSYIKGKNFTIDLHLTKKEISLVLEVTFDKRQQLSYFIDNDLYDLEKYIDVTKELLEDMRLLLSGIADGSVKFGYIAKKPSLLVNTTDGHELVYNRWFFTTKKKIDPDKAKEYSRLLSPLN